MREIQLTQGKVALVDDADFELVSQFRWHAWRDKSGSFYARAFIDGQFVYLHHLILGGKPPAGMVTDHVDRNTLNDGRSNLRFVSQSVNRLNTRNQERGKSGFLGVYQHGRKWRTKISFDGHRHSVG